MTMYFIGDLQGCDEPLQRLLDAADFSPSRDTLFVLGDLVNRGPDSTKVLRRLMGYGQSARCVLGNHDLHLLAVSHGARRSSRKDTLSDLLAAADRNAMLHWLSHQSMAMHLQVLGQDMLMVHAGVLPQWTLATTMALAAEVEDALRSANAREFFHTMYGNAPSGWHSSLHGTDRLRVIVNALTRMRFCTPQGDMEFESSGDTQSAPDGYLPWFDVPDRATENVTVAFGHWSTLGEISRPNLWALDSGCVWGGCLSAMQLPNAAKIAQAQKIKVKCPQAQKPGSD